MKIYNKVEDKHYTLTNEEFNNKYINEKDIMILSNLNIEDEDIYPKGKNINISVNNCIIKNVVFKNCRDFTATNSKLFNVSFTENICLELNNSYIDNYDNINLVVLNIENLNYDLYLEKNVCGIKCINCKNVTIIGESPIPNLLVKSINTNLKVIYNLTNTNFLNTNIDMDLSTFKGKFLTCKELSKENIYRVYELMKQDVYFTLELKKKITTKKEIKQIINGYRNRIKSAR